MQLYTQQYFIFSFKKHAGNPTDVALIHFIIHLFIFQPSEENKEKEHVPVLLCLKS